MSIYIRKIALALLLVSSNLIVNAQNNEVRIDNRDFEQTEVKPWIGLGNGAGIRTSTAGFHGGKQSLEITAGSTAQLKVGLKPNSTYKISAWVRTNSGSDEVQLHLVGLGSNNVSAVSALADWVKLEKTVVTGEGQNGAFIEVYHPETPGKFSAWLDDVNIEYVGVYLPVKPSSIKPLPVRKVHTEMGITQQPLEKLNWLLDARFGMFIHWGLYSGLAKGE